MGVLHRVNSSLPIRPQKFLQLFNQHYCTIQIHFRKAVAFDQYIFEQKPLSHIKMTRELFLLVYHANGKVPVPAHWTMFIPHTDGAVTGKKIHAVGSPFIGYRLEIQEYDISKTRRVFEKISLGSIDEGWLPHLNSKAEGVKPPGVSKKPLDPFAGERCQHWLESYVDVLLKDGVVLQSTVDILARAPKI
ncbi:hypothetical protein VTL71DRAFT_295 [Oculimacula yallundae]|uniref:Uncharacterized protein n=1 Tax=Oculimacula yallundae TaxID=86028 RepID=A0ABR4CZP8_9HELO